MTQSATPVKTVRVKGGKQYVEVVERVKYAHEQGRGFEILESVFTEVAGRVICQVKIKLDGKFYCGSAEAKLTGAAPGSADASNPLECAETSAVGRALGFAGMGSAESIASFDEIARGLTPTELAALRDDQGDKGQNGRRPAGASSANASADRRDQGGQRGTFTKVADQGQPAAAPTPASQPAPETDGQPEASAPADQRQPTEAARLFKKIDEMKIKRNHKVLTRPQILAWAFKNEIAASEGQLTVELLMQAGDQLGHDYCEVLKSFIQKIEDNRKAA